MDSSEPPVSVLTVTRRVDYLTRCVQSVRDQTYRGRVRHLLVIDDNPEALEVLHEMGVPATDIVYEKRAPGDEDGPGRLAALRNMAVATAGETWLAFIDDDNVWEPDHLGSLWSTIIDTGADMAHSQRKIFEADGRPYLREEFPWGRDALTRRAIYAYCVVAGIMSPGSNQMRDRLEMRFTWVDLGEWLFPPRFLNAKPFETAYGAWEWFNISVEDRELPRAVFNSGLKVAATGKPTLHYFMGGYTNSVEGDRVFWRDAADGVPPGWTADA